MVVVKLLLNPKFMPKEEIKPAPENEQRPVEVPEAEKKEVEKGERIFLSQVDDDLGFMRVVSSVPTEQPTTKYERIKVYVSGATKRLYIWDGTNNVWTYVNLTT